ncbi:BTAD domain-containing putative transcriptional regulator [Streptomyces echinoruber]|uniref:SARP family transcriptional regulator n=1 Tax=Streptomyces echinoruber TaxID=68898 RepID=A0A918R9T1_9ACTN|nr:SARP family transcriptional regulator [Streptomyces echinoruber]
MNSARVRVEVLGPLSAFHAGREVPLGPPRQRAVLVALLARAPYPVPTHRIMADVWGEDVPGHAPNLVQKYVSGLRRLLPAGARIVLTDTGYALEGCECDLAEFEQLIAHAQDLREKGGLEEAARTLTRAIGLWRGVYAEGVEGPGAELERERLAERLLVAREDLYALDIELGRGERHLAELTRLTARHPLRERPHALLMRVLARSGRQAEALDTYTRVRRRLVEEYGAEPGPELRAAHQEVLDTSAPPTPSTEPPSQLPLESGEFVGRSEDVARIVGQLRDGAPLICIEGTAGVGKTALAVHCAHQVKDAFPDGQLFADLRGFDHRGPADPAEVLGFFLRALGTPARQVPVDPRDRADALRSRLQGRRVLFVLDNAADAEHVRPLLPATAGCAALITSRRALVSLAVHDGALLTWLGVLPPGDSAALLRAALGTAGRTAPDQDTDQAVAEIARLCGHLPLALRVVAAGAARGRLGLNDVAHALAEVGSLEVSSLPHDERASVRASIGLSYRHLDDEARKLLRLLGSLPGLDLSLQAVAAATGTTEPHRLLAALTAANLLEQHAPGRFRFPHDLLREYAWERARREDGETDRQAALRQLIAWYTYVAQALGGDPSPVYTVGPGPGAHQEAAVTPRQARRELPNLLATVEYASQHGPYPAAWTLASLLHGPCKQQSRIPEWLSAAEAGLRAARRAANRRAEAELALNLVDATLTAGMPQEAERHIQRVLRLADTHGWPDLTALAREHLGRSRWISGDLDAARTLLTQALDGYAAVHDHLRTALALGALARVEIDAGDAAAAHRLGTRALRLSRAHLRRDLEAQILVELGLTHHALGRHRSARMAFQAGVALSRDGEPDEPRRPEALGQSYLGVLEAEAGRAEEARVLCAKGLRAARRLGDRWAEVECANAFGHADRALGAPDGAAAHYRHALRLARSLGYHRGQRHATEGLSALGLPPEDRPAPPSGARSAPRG